MRGSGSITMKRACFISAQPTSRHWFCTRTIRPGISITRRILSAAGTHRRVQTTFARSPSQCRTLDRFDCRTWKCKNRAGRIHPFARPQARKVDCGRGDGRPSERRSTRCLCEKIPKGGGPDDAVIDLRHTPREPKSCRSFGQMFSRTSRKLSNIDQRVRGRKRMLPSSPTLPRLLSVTGGRAPSPWSEGEHHAPIRADAGTV